MSPTDDEKKNGDLTVVRAAAEARIIELELRAAQQAAEHARQLAEVEAEQGIRFAGKDRELDELRKELGGLGKQLDGLKKHLGRKGTEHNSVRKSLEQQISELSGKLTQGEQEVGEITKLHQAVQRNLEEKNAEVRRITEEKEAALSRMELAQTKADAYKHSLDVFSLHGGGGGGGGGGGVPRAPGAPGVPRAPGAAAAAAAAGGGGGGGAAASYVPIDFEKLTKEYLQTRISEEISKTALFADFNAVYPIKIENSMTPPEVGNKEMVEIRNRIISDVHKFVTNMYQTEIKDLSTDDPKRLSFDIFNSYIKNQWGKTPNKLLPAAILAGGSGPRTKTKASLKFEQEQERRAAEKAAEKAAGAGAD